MNPLTDCNLGQGIFVKMQEYESVFFLRREKKTFENRKAEKKRCFSLLFTGDLDQFCTGKSGVCAIVFGGHFIGFRQRLLCRNVFFIRQSGQMEVDCTGDNICL